MKVGIIVLYCDELAVLVFVLVLVFGGESLVPNAILGESGLDLTCCTDGKKHVMNIIKFSENIMIWQF